MKLLKVDRNHVTVELGFDELGILHFALYDYLVKVEAKLNQKGQDKHKRKKFEELTEKLQSMVETVNSLI